MLLFGLTPKLNVAPLFFPSTTSKNWGFRSWRLFPQTWKFENSGALLKTEAPGAGGAHQARGGWPRGAKGVWNLQEDSSQADIKEC